jgi:very-short-patch-repair endonuclease
MEKIIKQMLSTVKSKQFSRFVKARQDLHAWLINLTNSYDPININEMIWIYINGPPPVCTYGSKRKFNSYEKGYFKCCGHSTCGCRSKLQSEKISSWHKSLTPEEKINLVNRAKKTFMENYGVDNVMKSEKVKSLREKNSLEKYGTKTPIESEEIQEMIKLTNIKKYGVEYPFQSTDIQQKSKAATLEKYGNLMTHARAAAYEKYHGKNPFTDTDVQAKIRDSMLRKYGTEHPLQNKDILESMKQKVFQQYGVKNVSQKHIDPSMLELLENVELFKEFSTGKTVHEIHNETGLSTTLLYRYIKRHNIDSIVSPNSLMQWDLRQWLDNNKIKYIENNRLIIKPFEIDFYLPDFQLGIELNGLASHSEIYAEKDKNYHKMKYDMCQQQGIQLLQIWQDEYWEKKSIVLDKISHLCGLNTKTLHARKADVRIVDSTDDDRSFLEKNHIQGFPDYRSVTIGAFIEGKLSACMSWAMIRNNMEMVRFATLIGHKSPGMFSKLLKKSVTILGLENSVIVTYSDNRYSNGELYEKTGWKMVKELAPDYCYTKNYCERENKKKFMKGKIMKKFALPITKLKYTEWQLMQELGYDRLWDCGKKRWEYEIKNT